ncbi:L,D-transpeptidase/peptidoglycan binding protein [Anaerovorax odorimutans]|uniref:L,D-transpeptidase/peptidoglycan binding protein n=1 Tax=Anaerovorax odorimutans TaxID=109327 RepID=A0ABT1RME9_9FIRM|nr:L,D-transpeptidase family protein [Anaerovorax odorimutans]MCQ4636364.1 L,D-transpeptidase/peptidoglycan binding protein [Anaerovorax odorimutans]
MKKILIPLIIVLCLAGGGFAVWKVLDANVFSVDVLPQKTTINTIDCSGLTTEQAKEKLIKEWNSKTFNFTADGKTLGSISDLHFDYGIDDAMANVKKDHFFSAALNYFFKADFDASVDMTVKKVNKAFKTDLKNADYLKEKDPVETKDAYVDLSSEDFKIVPEVYGNNIDYDVLLKKITDLIAKNTFTLEYQASDFYTKPKVTADSEEIKERQEFCKKYLTSKVTYILGKDEVKIPPEELEKIFDIEVVESGSPSESEKDEAEKAAAKVTIKEDAVRDYVKKLAKEYNTLGKTREFTSLSNRKVKVSGGDYGWALSVDKETKQLIKDLKSGEEVKREPVWLMTGFGDYNKEDDIGNTYVEVSLAEQHLWYFKDGKEIVNCPVVTGNVLSGYNTPAGTFSLTYKQRGATLKGNNADGTSYSSPVSYWMPFYGNYGMHDAPWRGAFGGSIYRGSGSHGCVNMPVASAKKLFSNLANKGTPVVVHW